MVQIGRLVSDGAFSLEVCSLYMHNSILSETVELFRLQMQIKSRELLFPFEYDRKIYRTIIELKHLTSWKVHACI